MTEIWKDVVGYEGRYQVSNLGRLRSCDIVLTKKDGKNELRKGKVLLLQKNCHGYYMHLMSDGSDIRKLIPIHRIVAEAFIPNPENKPCIDHINTVRTDNRVENLRWCNMSENMLNPITRERMRNCRPDFKHTDDTKKLIGDLQRGVKKSQKAHESAIRRGHNIIYTDPNGDVIEFEGVSFAAEYLGICKSSVLRICSGLRKNSKYNLKFK